jgi:hypothetical protein
MHLKLEAYKISSVTWGKDLRVRITHASKFYINGVLQLQISRLEYVC